MNHYGTLRDFRFSDKDADDIRGQDIYGLNDEKLGDIDDVIFDHSSGDIRYVVVDAGGWLSSDKFLVPADRLRSSAKHKNDYEVNLTKDQIKSFPAYDENAVNDRDRWGDYESRYNAGWTTDGDVQHRADAPDKNITPTTDEMAASGLSSRTSNVGSTRPTGATDAGALRSTGSGQRETVSTGTGARTHLGEHWTNFESRIRRDRAQITGSCGVCRIEPGSVGTADLGRKVG
jgi:sporulation protein YlmC with PRC-barrel domain